MVVLARFLSGFGIGGVLVITTMLVSEGYREKRRAVLLGILSISIPVGIFSAGLFRSSRPVPHLKKVYFGFSFIPAPDSSGASFMRRSLHYSSFSAGGSSPGDLLPDSDQQNGEDEKSQDRFRAVQQYRGKSQPAHIAERIWIKPRKETPDQDKNNINDRVKHPQERMFPF
jgi:hypothetical protein